MPTIDVKGLLAAYSRDEVGKDAVMRACMSHDDWLVPAVVLATVYGARSIQDPILFGDEVALPADRISFFSDPEAAMMAQSQGARLGTYGRGVSGATLFGGLLPAWQTVFVNPGSPPPQTLIFSGKTLELASVWAGALAFEAVLADARRPYDDGPLLEALFGYQDYLLMLDAKTAGIMTVKTNAYSKAAVVFTANDCADAHFEFFPSDRETHRVVAMPGAQLFRILVLQGFDGVSFNGFGPGIMAEVPTAPFIPVFAAR